MFALHWICALTLVLVSCLSAQPVKRTVIIPEGDFKAMKDAIEKKNCSDSIRLYSPSEIREDCMSSAVNCTISELSVLEHDCGIENDAMDNFIDALNQSLLETNWNNQAPDCICEKYNQTDVTKFVANIEHQVQLLNSMYWPQR